MKDLIFKFKGVWVIIEWDGFGMFRYTFFYKNKYYYEYVAYGKTSRSQPYGEKELINLITATKITAKKRITETKLKVGFRGMIIRLLNKIYIYGTNYIQERREKVQG